MTRIIIRAVPSRQAMIDYLKRELPDAEWCIDPHFARTDMDNRLKASLNMIQAMRLAGLGPAIHMEEDVRLAASFREKIEAAIAERPNVLIQFFSMRQDDVTVGSRWDNSFAMNQCFYLPAGYSALLGEYLPVWMAAHPDDPGGYDPAMRAWLRARKERYWIHCPSLVDHLEAVSIMDRRRSSKRQSKTFQG